MRLLLLLVACAGNLEDPERFNVDGDPACDAPALLKQKCTGGACHTASGPAARLDLVSADVGLRLRDVAAVGCGAGMLVDSTRPSDSVMLKRLDASSCGGAMPPSAPLTTAERRCLETWVGEGAP